MKTKVPKNCERSFWTQVLLAPRIHLYVREARIEYKYVIEHYISESGLLEVISPPAEFYPDPTTLRKTLGKIQQRISDINNGN